MNDVNDKLPFEADLPPSGLTLPELKEWLRVNGWQEVSHTELVADSLSLGRSVLGS